MTGPVTPTPSSTQPTPLAERTLVGALIALCLLVLAFGAALLFPHWPDAVALERIKYLGEALLILVGGILLLVAIFASPWVGTIRLTAMGADLDIGGKDKGDGA